MGYRATRGSTSVGSPAPYFSQQFDDPRQQEHRDLIRDTLDRLMPYYDEVSVEQKYFDHTGQERGEFDILVEDRNVHQYYEVKTSNTPSLRNRGRQQFRRALEYFPDRNWRFILVTPERVFRYTPTDLHRLERQGQR